MILSRDTGASDCDLLPYVKLSRRAPCVSCEAASSNARSVCLSHLHALAQSASLHGARVHDSEERGVDHSIFIQGGQILHANLPVTLDARLHEVLLHEGRGAEEQHFVLDSDKVAAERNYVEIVFVHAPCEKSVQNIM